MKWSKSESATAVCQRQPIDNDLQETDIGSAISVGFVIWKTRWPDDDIHDGDDDTIDEPMSNILQFSPTTRPQKPRALIRRSLSLGA